jgi:hypothetical protein
MEFKVKVATINFIFIEYLHERFNLEFLGRIQPHPAHCVYALST